jgi:hypothetical protein
MPLSGFLDTEQRIASYARSAIIEFELLKHLVLVRHVSCYSIDFSSHPLVCIQSPVS